MFVKLKPIIRFKKFQRHNSAVKYATVGIFDMIDRCYEAWGRLPRSNAYHRPVLRVLGRLLGRRHVHRRLRAADRPDQRHG